MPISGMCRKCCRCPDKRSELVSGKTKQLKAAQQMPNFPSLPLAAGQPVASYRRVGDGEEDLLPIASMDIYAYGT